MTAAAPARTRARWCPVAPNWHTCSMRDDPFAPCWHRWNRANEHRASLAEIWNSFIADHPYDFSLNHEGDGQYVLRLWQEAPMPPHFAVIMGEWLYNLRSTLDYVIWATAVYATGQSPRRTRRSCSTRSTTAKKLGAERIASPVRTSHLVQRGLTSGSRRTTDPTTGRSNGPGHAGRLCAFGDPRRRAAITRLRASDRTSRSPDARCRGCGLTTCP